MDEPSSVNIPKAVSFVAGGLGFGGQERALSTLANALSRSGLQVSIICLFQSEQAFELEDDIIVIWPERSREDMGKWFYVIWSIKYVRHNVRQLDTNTVIAFGDWFHSFTVLATRGLGVNVHLASRMGPMSKRGRLNLIANKVLFPFATSMIVQTNRAREIFDKRYHLKKLSVIPNLIEFDQEIPQKSNNSKTIICVGRLSREKGQSVLIKAFAEASLPDWRIVFLGDGPDRQMLQALAESEKVSKSIYFAGNVKDVWVFLRHAEIFCLPSYYEGFPNALIEAMSMGLCCVATDCVAGPREIIQNGNNGFLFPTGDYLALSELLSELANDPMRRQVVGNRAVKVRNIYHRDGVVRSWLEAVAL